MKRSCYFLAFLVCLIGCNRKPEPVPTQEEVPPETAPVVQPKKDPLNGREVVYWIERLGNEVTSTQAQGVLATAGEPVVPALIEALQSQNERTRTGAQSALSRIGKPAVQPLTDALANDAVGDRAVVCLVQIGSASIAPVTKALEDKDAKVRTRAVQTLKRLAKTEANAVARESGEPLLGLLKDPDEVVRAAAASALVDLPLRADAIPSLRTALKADDPATRAGAVRALATLGRDAKEAGPDIVEVLKNDGKEPVRIAAAQALAKVKDTPGAVAALAGAVKKDDKARVRQAAAAALGELSEEAKVAVPALASALDDKETSVRIAAALALAEFSEDGTPAIPALAKSLQDEDPKIRSAAIKALVYIGKPARGELAKAIKSPHPEVRLPALKAIIDAGGDEAKAAVPLVAAGLKDKNAATRKEAAESLKLFGADAKPALPALTLALKDESTDVRLRSVECLANIGKPAADALVTALKNDNDDVREKATTAIGELAPEVPAAIPVLADIIQNEKSGPTRHSAVTALTRYGPAARPAIKPLLALLRETDDAMRERAHKALAAIGADAVPGLMELLRDKEMWNNSRAYSWVVRALTKIGKPAVSDLTAALKDPQLNVRITAAGILGGIGPDASEAAPALMEAAKDPDRGLSRAANEALKKVKPAD